MFVIRDRDYLLDGLGNYLKVVGDYHPDDRIISYIKYFPSDYGTRRIDEQNYEYNSFVAKSFVLLFNQKDRVCYSDYHGGIITCTPRSRVQKLFSCKQGLRSILERQDEVQAHPTGKELIDFLTEIKDEVHLDDFGITGSFLLNCYNTSSDIDLVCYGRRACEETKAIFHRSNHILSYKDTEFAQTLYTRRMAHMNPLDFELLLKQESRKFQGVTKRHHVHINCQPLREENDNYFDSLRLREVGEISCIALITNDEEGIFSPAYYEIRVLDILESLFSGSRAIKTNIKALIAFMDYENTFRMGDRVFIAGKLVQIEKGEQLYYGIELTSWNTSRTFTALLLE